MSYKPLAEFNGYVWELIEEINVNNSGSINTLIDNLNGDSDEVYYIEFQLFARYTYSSYMMLCVYFNEDFSTNTMYRCCLNTCQDNGAYSCASLNEMDKPIIGHWGGNNDGYIGGSAHIFAKSGTMRYVTSVIRSQGEHWDDSAWGYVITSTWKNSSDNVNSLRIMSENMYDITGWIKVYKKTRIISLTPYKKLIAQADNVNQLNGMTITIQQDKKYEIEFECSSSSALSSNIEMLANNDSTLGNYKYAVIGNNESGSGDISAFRLAYQGANCYNISGIFYPYTRLWKKIYYASENLSTVTIRYLNGQVDTLNITSPNDNIPCKFKVWEITE